VIKMLEVNLLPYDGTVNYKAGCLSANQADKFYNLLLNETQWQPDQVIIFGKLRVTKRKMAWYGDVGAEYRYAGISRTPIAWTPALQELKKITESICGTHFNSCLLNLYHNGSEGMGWHSDDEPELVSGGTIASLSLGAERRFYFRHRRTGEKIVTNLEHGSLLLMKGQTQYNWVHQLPVMKRVMAPRINLTFRQIR
jgi:alkylated DNA repair dioxygenase AlkB